MDEITPQPLSQSQRRSVSPNSSRVWALVLLGAGLILLGVAAAVFLLSGNAQAFATGKDSIEVSVVPVRVEYPAPDLSLNGLDGKKHTLADYLGSVVLVNNWATWCPPCKAEMPTLQQYYEEHQDQGFVLIAIEAGEPEEEVRDFVQEYGLTFPVWTDRGLRALNAFKNDNLPSSYVIDREGIIRLAWTGPISQAMLEKYLTPLLEE